MINKINGIAKLINRIDYSQKLVEFEFEMIEPVELNFKPGQYISIQIEQFVRRSYSVLNAPEESKNKFKILIDTTPMGKATVYLLNLQIGDQISFIGQIGNFVLPDELNKNLLFISTGTGIAPLNSMIDSLVISRKYLEHNIYVYYGTSYLKELIYEDKYNYYKYSKIISDYKAFISRETNMPNLPFLKSGRVTDVIDQLENDIKKDCQVFLCGNSDMIEDVKGLLIFKGFKPAQIYNEKFY